MYPTEEVPKRALPTTIARPDYADNGTHHALLPVAIFLVSSVDSPPAAVSLEAYLPEPQIAPSR